MSIKRTAASLATFLLLSTNASATLYFSQDSNNTGLYELNVTTGAATPVGLSGVTSSTVGLAPSADPTTLFGSRWASLLVINADGSGATDLGGAGNEGLAYCSSNSTLYGAINGSFQTIDQSDGSIIDTLSSPGIDMEGIACDPATSTIYGIGNSTNLYAYDIGTDSWSLIGDTGTNWNSGGLAWDPEGRLFAIGAGGGDNLYVINPTTAAASLIGPTGVTNTRGGLAFVGPASEIIESVAVPAFSLWGLGSLIALFGFAGSRRRKSL